MHLYELRSQDVVDGCARARDPAARAAIDAVNDLVSGGALYKALKEIRKPIKREEELLAA